MKKLLIMGSSFGSKELVEYAKSQGIYTIVTDYNDPSKSSAKQYADESWMISTADFDELEKKCKEEKIDGIICGISGFNVPCSIEMCKRLGLPFYTTKEAWQYTGNKYDFKALCRKVGLPVATDYFVSDPPTEEELLKIKFPVVVKAVDLGANRGMSYCGNTDEVKIAIEYAHSLSKNRKVVIERELHGTEYGAYYALTNGEASLVSLWPMLNQPGLPSNCYSVQCTDCDVLDVFLKEVDPYCKRFFKEGGMTDGVCWFELIHDSDGHFYALEMGYRLSGDMMALPLIDTTGFNSYKWLVENSLGVKKSKDDLPPSQTVNYEKCGCSYILWSNETSGVVKSIEGVNQILEIPGVKLTPKVKVGDSFGPHQYLLTFTFTCDNAKQVCELIEKINKTVSVNDENDDDVVIRFTDFERIKKLRK